MTYIPKLNKPYRLTALYQLEPKYEVLTSPSGLSGIGFEVKGSVQYIAAFGFSDFNISAVKLKYNQVLGCAGFTHGSTGVFIVSRGDGKKAPYNLKAQYNLDALYSPLLSPSNLKYKYDGPDGDNRYISPQGVNSLQLGQPQATYSQLLNVVAIEPNVRFGLISLINRNQKVISTSFSSSMFGTPTAYNLKQYAPLQGNDQSSYGTAYLQGGVRWINNYGIAPLGVGTPALLNTTANKYIYTTGVISKLVVPAPIVTPHMIYARGIYSTAFGSVKVIPTPVLQHKGVNHLIAGTPTIWFHTRPLEAKGFESYNTGYPKAFDPTQHFSPSPTLRSSVFGDVRIRNNNSHLLAPSIYSQAISEWATVESRNRSLYAKSFVAQAFGNQLIKNKSPSIFFHGLPAPIFYNQAIGYRIRKVSPTGFDRLGLGNPVVIKTPELLPNGLDATGFGLQWVSNYTRHIQNNSKDHSSAGVPVVWFRFRYVTPGSWQSSVISDGATVTHGVREVIAQGFIQQGYGIGWVSRGIRLLEPISINQGFFGNHYVGRPQGINPYGFVATRFGTRIIPEIQALYPLGFAGVFGLALADLATKYLKPKGYLSAGEQPAFRWGRQIVFNSDQYIKQDFAGDNGLVPPKWSDWTAIENRNKNIGAIGTAMQRFGYAQIDNNARLLAPQGLIATRFDRSMISYRIRTLPLQGIESPYMSDWLVVRNSARVIKPAGAVQSLFGNADAVKTRRYLDRIGHIESFEAGTAMIAYRIRTLEIEKRYSIAPPVIRLPTVDLYTRYIEFRGYETAKYGLASLSIHFRIITPRWAHSEKSGQPALRNVTPELLTRGHDSQEYGNTSIRTQWRNVDAQGDNTAAIGLLKISDTKQHVSVRGFIDSLSSQQHTIIKGKSAPYSLQYVYLNDENNTKGGEGDGIKPAGLGYHAINQNVLYINGFVGQAFGTAFLWSNNIVIDSGIGTENITDKLMVTNKDRGISLDGRGMNNEIKVGRPRLSPHTIYSTFEAPQQAKDNHFVSGLHRVGESDQGHASSRVGFPRLESSIRSIYPYYVHSNKLGIARATLSKQVIEVEGFRRSRFGLPGIPFTLQTIGLRSGIDGMLFGVVKLTRPPYTGPQTISLKGIYNTLFGATYADNYVRMLYARGSNSLSMGQSKSDDKPFMWQGLRVGEHIPLIIGGDDMSRHGLTWISLRVRDISAKGFNAFKSEYELSAFDERIKVSNADKKLPIAARIEALGIKPSTAIGYQDIKLGQYFIRPDGNSDQFRKGGYHA